MAQGHYPHQSHQWSPKFKGHLSISILLHLPAASDANSFPAWNFLLPRHLQYPALWLCLQLQVKKESKSNSLKHKENYIPHFKRSRYGAAPGLINLMVQQHHQGPTCPLFLLYHPQHDGSSPRRSLHSKKMMVAVSGAISKGDNMQLKKSVSLPVCLFITSEETFPRSPRKSFLTFHWLQLHHTAPPKSVPGKETVITVIGLD